MSIKKSVVSLLFLEPLLSYLDIRGDIQGTVVVIKRIIYTGSGHLIQDPALIRILPFTLFELSRNKWKGIFGVVETPLNCVAPLSIVLAFPFSCLIVWINTECCF